MTKRDVTGRTIVRIHQERFYNAHLGCWDYDFHSIDLDNGKRIIFTAVEAIDQPAVHASVVEAN